MVIPVSKELVGRFMRKEVTWDTLIRQIVPPAIGEAERLSPEMELVRVQQELAVLELDAAVLAAELDSPRKAALLEKLNLLREELIASGSEAERMLADGA